ncbi:MAG: VOC family protein [Candidatus Nanohaloarchaea archaeon]
MKPNLRHVTLKVEDIQRMRNFYEELLDPELHEEEPGRLIEYNFDGVLFGLYNPEADFDDAGKITRGNSCVPGFKVGKEFDKYREIVEQEKEAEIIYEAEEAGHKWLVFKDPEGNRVEFYRGSV